MPGSKYKTTNPALGFEFMEVEIPELPHFETGIYTCGTKPNAFDLPFPITCVVSSKPSFQILISIFPGTGEILILLGRVDNTPPITSKIYQVPNNLDSSRLHTFRVIFRNWNIDKFTINGHIVKEKQINEFYGFGAQRYIEELKEITKSWQNSSRFNGQEPLLERVHPNHGPAFSFLQSQKIL